MYLRCKADDDSSMWEQYLAWMKYWYSTAYQTSVEMTPFRALYGRDPPTILNYLEGSYCNAQVNHDLQERNALLRVLKGNLVQAQGCMKNQADKRRRELELEEGSWDLCIYNPIDNCRYV